MQVRRSKEETVGRRVSMHETSTLYLQCSVLAKTFQQEQEYLHSPFASGMVFPFKCKCVSLVASSSNCLLQTQFSVMRSVSIDVSRSSRSANKHSITVTSHPRQTMRTQTHVMLHYVAATQKSPNSNHFLSPTASSACLLFSFPSVSGVGVLQSA